VLAQANFPEPTSIAKIVDGLCIELGFVAKFDEPIPENVMFQGVIKLEKLPVMLEGLLGKHGYEAVPDGWTMHIRKKGSTPRNLTLATQSNNQLRTENERDPNLMYYPDGTSVTKERWKWLLHLYGPERMAEKMQEMRVQARLSSLTPDTLPTPAVAPPQMATTQSYYPPSAEMAPYMGRRTRYGYYDPFWVNYMRQYQNAGAWGRLKIDGPEGFLQTVHVFVDGHPLSPASKANSRINEGLAVPAGNHDIQLMWMDQDEVKVLSWRGYTIRPMMVQKHCWVGGKQEIYDRAPKATEEEEATYRSALGLSVGTMR